MQAAAAIAASRHAIVIGRDVRSSAPIRFTII
jgi:hypothetical protein